MSTSLPLSDNDYKDLQSFDEAHIVHGQSHPAMQKKMVIIDRAQNTVYKDVQGEEYIDAMGGLTVNTIGHSRKELAQVAFDQMQKLEFVANSKSLTNPNAIHLADKLLSLAKPVFPRMNAVFFTSGGSEANEVAYHLSLRYFANKGILGHGSKFKVISFNNCYHGTTFFSFSTKPELTDYGWQRIGSLSGAPKNFNWFSHIDFPHELFFKGTLHSGENVGQAAARILEETILREGPETVAVLIGEPIQGNGGVVIPHPDFWPLARTICDKHNVLIIADEIMTFTKTGKWFAMENWNTAPDIITVSKGLTSGYAPLGAVIMSEEIQNVAFHNLGTKMSMSRYFQHDYTWSGHPVGTALALKNLEIIEREGMLATIQSKGKIFLDILKNKLSGLRLVREVRGMGIMLGVDLATKIGMDVEAKLTHEYKILCLSGMNKHTLTITPSPMMPEEQMHKIANALYEILTSFATQAESLISGGAE